MGECALLREYLKWSCVICFVQPEYVARIGRGLIDGKDLAEWFEIHQARRQGCDDERWWRRRCKRDAWRWNQRDGLRAALLHNNERCAVAVGAGLQCVKTAGRIFDLSRYNEIVRGIRQEGDLDLYGLRGGEIALLFDDACFALNCDFTTASERDGKDLGELVRGRNDGIYPQGFGRGGNGAADGGGNEHGQGRRGNECCCCGRGGGAGRCERARRWNERGGGNNCYDRWRTRGGSALHRTEQRYEEDEGDNEDDDQDERRRPREPFGNAHVLTFAFGV